MTNKTDETLIAISSSLAMINYTLSCMALSSIEDPDVRDTYTEGFQELADKLTNKLEEFKRDQ